MIEDIDYFLRQNQELIRQNGALNIELNEAREFIEAIKRGGIDAVFVANNESTRILSSKTADQSYRKFIENMSEGVVTLHANGIILYSNSSFAKMVGLPLEKVIGMNLNNFIPEEFMDSYLRFFHENSSDDAKFELSILNDGIRSHFSVSLNKIQVQDFMALNLVWTDVSHLKRTEEKLMIANENLIKANQAAVSSEDKAGKLNDRLSENIIILEEANIELGTFAHIASHDLQEPIRKILTYCSYLVRDYTHIIDERGQNYIKNIQRASERMRDLIQDILEYSELSQNDIEFKPTNFQSIIEEVLSDLEVAISETKARITLEKELPVFDANAGQMRQLFQNLISNSLKYSRDGIIPELSITYQFTDHKENEQASNSLLNEKYCRIYVKDNGIGFDSKYNEKIFTVFQRLHSNSVYKGTGIGLSICKKIVEKHNGTITAQGIVNEGSLFTITLPIRQIAFQIAN